MRRLKHVTKRDEYLNRAPARVLGGLIRWKIRVEASVQVGGATVEVWGQTSLQRFRPRRGSCSCRLRIGR